MASNHDDALARLALTLAAIAATLGGWLALASSDATAPQTPEHELGPLPTLEPSATTPTTMTIRALPATDARRPVPVAISRSSR